MSGTLPGLIVRAWVAGFEASKSTRLRFFVGSTQRFFFKIVNISGLPVDAVGVNFTYTRGDGLRLVISGLKDAESGLWFADLFLDVVGSWTVEASCDEPQITVDAITLEVVKVRAVIGEGTTASFVDEEGRFISSDAGLVYSVQRLTEAPIATELENGDFFAAVRDNQLVRVDIGPIKDAAVQNVAPLVAQAALSAENAAGSADEAAEKADQASAAVVEAQGKVDEAQAKVDLANAAVVAAQGAVEDAEAQVVLASAVVEQLGEAAVTAVQAAITEVSADIDALAETVNGISEIVTEIDEAKTQVQANRDSVDESRVAVQAAATGVQGALSAVQGVLASVEVAYDQVEASLVGLGATKTAVAEDSAAARDSRLAAEVASEMSDTARDASVAAYMASETARGLAETAQAGALTALAASVDARDAAVVAQTLAETAKVDAQEAVGLAEVARNEAQTARGLADSARASAETARNEAQAASNGVEAVKEGAEDARDAAVAAQAAAQTAQGLAQTAREGAVAAQASAEAAHALAVTIGQEAEASAQNAETAREEAEAARDAAQAALASATSVTAGTDEALAAVDAALESAEETQVAIDASLAAATAARISAEAALASALAARTDILAARDVAVTAKNDAGTAKDLAVQANNTAVAAATAAGVSKTDAEAARIGAQTAQTAAEVSRQASQTAQGLAETARASAVAARTAAETAQGLAETSSTAASAARGAAETAKGAAETARSGAETARTAAELAEDRAEISFTGAEAARAEALSSKTAAASSASSADTAKTAAESARDASQTARTASEAARDTAVTARTGVETARDLAVAARVGAEAASGTAETARAAAVAASTAAETARGLAVTARTGAETAQGLAVAARTAAEDARTVTEAARDLSIGARVGSENARDESIAAQTLAQQKAVDAETARAAAADQATLAGQRASTAEIHSNAAAESASQAAAILAQILALPPSGGTAPSGPSLSGGYTVESGAPAGRIIGEFAGLVGETVLTDNAGGRFTIDAYNRLVTTGVVTDFLVAPLQVIVATRNGMSVEFPISVQQSIQARILAISSCQAYWPLNETGMAVDGSGITDVKRNNTAMTTFKVGSGVMLGRPSLVKNQPSRKSMYFSATGVGNIYTSAYNVAASGLDKAGNTAFTIMDYTLPDVTRSGPAKDYIIVSKRRIAVGDANRFKGYQFGLYWDGTKTVMRFIISSTETDMIEIRSTTDITNTPHHVCVTVPTNKSATSHAFYLDGVVETLNVVTNSFTGTSAAPDTGLNIGSHPGGDGGYFSGRLSDLVFFSAQLSAAVVAQLAQPAAVAPLPLTYPRGTVVPTIILDTDTGQDVDDYGTVGMLMGFARRGEANILAVGASKFSAYSAPSLQALMVAGGYGSVPLGANLRTTTLGGVAKVDPEGSGPAIAARAGITKTRPDYEDAMRVYRRALASSAGGVSICVIGGLTNIARLLQSPADDISTQTGLQLVAAKVDKFYCMGGIYSSEGGGGAEYNINQDPEATYQFAQLVNRPVIWADFALGNGQQWAFAGNPDNNIFRFAVETSYGGGLFERLAGWDLHPVWAAVKGVPNTVHGFATQNKAVSVTRASGNMSWVLGTAGLHSVLSKIGSDTVMIPAFDAAAQDGIPGG